jgi:hypothetical protein
MGAFLLFLIYGSLVFFEVMLLHQILEDEYKGSFSQTTGDVVAVNLLTMVLIVFIFGPVLSRLEGTGTMTQFFQKMLVTWPHEIVKISFFSIVSDAVILAGWYYFRYPEQKQNLGLIALRGALMNVPAFILMSVSWAFTEIMRGFFQFLGGGRI